MAAQRILIVGSGGSGKSTLAKQLGPLLGLPVVHLDVHFWNPGWKATSEAEWESKVEQLVAMPSWIVDGNYSKSLEVRLRAADVVIFLDLPRGLCLGRVLLRQVVNWGRTREDLGSGCKEKLDLEFLRWVWDYPRRSRQKVLRLLEAFSDRVSVVVLRTPAEVRRLLATAAATGSLIREVP